MIVADENLLAYLVIAGGGTATAGSHAPTSKVARGSG